MIGQRPFLLVFSVILGAIFLSDGIGPTMGQALPRDEPGFTSRVAEMLSGALPDYKITVKEALTLEVASPTRASPAQANLDRIWAFCNRNRVGCEQAVNEYVAGVSSSLKERDQPINASMLRVVIRHADYINDIRKSSKEMAAELVAEPLTGDLWIIAVIDMPRAMKLLGDGQLAELKLSRGEAIELGKRNVAKGLRPLKSVIRDLPAQGFGYLTGDTFESSRLALHDEWADVAKSMKGKLIVSIPAPDVVLYGDTGNPTAADAMASFARDAARRAQRPISVTLFEWAPAGWRPYSP